MKKVWALNIQSINWSNDNMVEDDVKQVYEC